MLSHPIFNALVSPVITPLKEKAAVRHWIRQFLTYRPFHAQEVQESVAVSHMVLGSTVKGRKGYQVDVLKEGKYAVSKCMMRIMNHSIEI